VAMRELLRHLASTGKTVFVSSHLLAEVTQMADLVGIIATGRLVREGSIDDLLHEMGSLRIRASADESARAREVLEAFGTVSTELADRPDEAWLELQVAPARSSEVNRALAEAGIYAAELRVGSGLEDLFLSLTQGAESADGTFQPIGTSGEGPGAAA